MAQPVGPGGLGKLSVIPSPVMGKICSYVGELNLLAVSRIFSEGEYVSRSLRVVCRTLLSREQVYWEQRQKEASEILPIYRTFEQLEERFLAQVEQAIQRNTLEHQASDLGRRFTQILTILRFYQDPNRRPDIDQSQDRWTIFFHRMISGLDSLNTLDQFDAQAEDYLLRRATLQQRVVSDFRSLDATMKVECRFKEILQPRRGEAGPERDYEDSAQTVSCLKALFQNQRRVFGDFRCDVARLRAAYQEDINLSRAAPIVAERFIRAEIRRAELDIEQDKCLNKLWNQIPGRPLFNTTAERRAWINNPGLQAPILNMITHLQLDNYSLIPAEIGRLRGLRILQCIADQDTPPEDLLADLPDELAEIRFLDQLEIVGGDFAKIPDVVARLNCSQIRFLDNRNRAVTISEKVADAHCWGLTSHFVEAVTGVGIGDLFEYEQDWVDEGGVPRFLGLRRETIAELPFSLRFRDLFSISYVRCVTQLTESLIDWWIVGSERIGLGEVESTLISFPILAFLIGLNIFINVPIFLVNLFTNWVIQPIVSLIRDLFGYDRMVRLQ